MKSCADVRMSAMTLGAPATVLVRRKRLYEHGAESQ